MAAPRRRWLDRQRGIAVLLMVEVHTLDAWLAPRSGEGPLRDALLMAGGFAAPAFLFMAGLSQVLGDAALGARGAPPGERRRRALGRAAWLLGVAYAFRGLEYALGGAWRVAGGWRDLLRVDILNVLAVALALGAILLVGRARRLQLAVAAGAALAVVLCTPPAAAWAHVPSRVLDYLYATYPRANFSLLNWVGFFFGGAAAGALVAERDRPWPLLALAAAVAAAAAAAHALPAFYAHQDFWRTSPAWFGLRLAGVLALTALLQLAPAEWERGLGWLTTLGRHSLLGYVASVELTYGVASHPLHRALSMGSVLCGIAVMSAVTWLLALAAERLSPRRHGGSGAAVPSTPSPA
ncbi:heparan-alpha-glucosaminide N-acetyltransferase domain-containing protein [Anaeromyxobacter diazotrophicus]|uniref:Heparan-alpha-glucosaminide N-acetyltransferase catalytic domain-containing protein n=1 Tax=Anaeromyxobacter diazotrophicus TaxID=2590199 RepID=A0A7I9VPG8_9BACT|nr:heparan-alpha-glucosaminide N-acetyltransferase domain-containing protein [Anaeromyxobacter diazotrophicus]GEJ58010.1 hypothetical protein AMYX_27510 [Anaeromyxobacter diazotrophicus]